MPGRRPQKPQVVVPNVPFVPGNPYKRKGAKAKLQLGSSGPIAAQFSYPAAGAAPPPAAQPIIIHHSRPSSRSVSRSRSRSPRRHGSPIIVADSRRPPPEILRRSRSPVHRSRRRSPSPRHYRERRRRSRTPSPIIVFPGPRGRSRSPPRRHYSRSRHRSRSPRRDDSDRQHPIIVSPNPPSVYPQMGPPVMVPGQPMMMAPQPMMVQAPAQSPAPPVIVSRDSRSSRSRSRRSSRSHLWAPPPQVIVVPLQQGVVPSTYQRPQMVPGQPVMIPQQPSQQPIIITRSSSVSEFSSIGSSPSRSSRSSRSPTRVLVPAPTWQQPQIIQVPSQGSQTPVPIIIQQPSARTGSPGRSEYGDDRPPQVVIVPSQQGQPEMPTMPRPQSPRMTETMAQPRVYPAPGPMMIAPAPQPIHISRSSSSQSRSPPRRYSGLSRRYSRSRSRTPPQVTVIGSQPTIAQPIYVSRSRDSSPTRLPTVLPGVPIVIQQPSRGRSRSPRSDGRLSSVIIADDRRHSPSPPVVMLPPGMQFPPHRPRSLSRSHSRSRSYSSRRRSPSRHRYTRSRSRSRSPHHGHRRHSRSPQRRSRSPRRRSRSSESPRGSPSRRRRRPSTPHPSARRPTGAATSPQSQSPLPLVIGRSDSWSPPPIILRHRSHSRSYSTRRPRSRSHTPPRHHYIPRSRSPSPAVRYRNRRSPSRSRSPPAPPDYWPEKDGPVIVTESHVEPGDPRFQGFSYTAPEHNGKEQVETLQIVVPDASGPHFETASRRPLSDMVTLVTYTLPHMLYLHILLRLPKFYYARVANIFVQCELMMPDIQQMAVATSKQWKDLGKQGVIKPATWDGMPVQTFSPALSHFKDTWETFIEALLREWSTLNIISALLLPAILTLLQIDAAVHDPIARTAALISLICALMSLLYGCLYIMRFGTMRQPHKAASWAMEAQKLEAGILWSPWVMLSMPAIWLCWSLITFLVCIMAYVWRSNSINSPEQRVTSAMVALGTRTAISCVLGLGLVCLIGIVSTFSGYGDEMDEVWSEHVVEWAKMLPGATILGEPNEKGSDYYDYYEDRSRSSRSRTPSPKIHTTTVIVPQELQYHSPIICRAPSVLSNRSLCRGRQAPMPLPAPDPVPSPEPLTPSESAISLFSPFRLMSISPMADNVFTSNALDIFTAQEVPKPLLERGLTLPEWRRLCTYMDGSTLLTFQNAEPGTVDTAGSLAFRPEPPNGVAEPSAIRPEPPNGVTEPPKQEATVAVDCIEQWNKEILAAKGLQAVICRTIDSPLGFSVYISEARKTETMMEGEEIIAPGNGELYTGGDGEVIRGHGKILTEDGVIYGRVGPVPGQLVVVDPGTRSREDP